MSPKDDAWKRFRDREDEKESEIGTPSAPSARDGSERLEQLLAQAPSLIEQVHNLYQQYFAGAEKRPPLERRKQLDQLMETILLLPKPNPGLQFRSTSARQQYMTYRDRWEKLLKDFETGKLNPTSAAKRTRQ